MNSLETTSKEFSLSEFFFNRLSYILQDEKFLEIKRLPNNSRPVGYALAVAVRRLSLVEHSYNQEGENQTVLN